MRGLRWDAKGGNSFRGPPTGLAGAELLPNKRCGLMEGVPYGPGCGGTGRFTPVVRVGPRFRTAVRAARIRRATTVPARFAEGGTGRSRSTVTNGCDGWEA
ncbi:hypothetical protein GCM10010329_05470 [Streptomyces spiroverticillatus]|uniref:Uncharacterized protein n=1 Tax=Streptomyces finlayi TaxID=67296 RepID=A0A919C7E6_9ACTN|nr:hypothetical protein GCM10010329_05470 [Streptomyces spiroverticillatus]GHC79315.1 hypothetical protein GCM10010334_05450 [Streptomyces finlayi]